MKAYRLTAFTATLLITALMVFCLRSPTAHASSSRQCASHLTVELTPHVNNPHDAAFLRSLLSHYTDFELRWVRWADDSKIVLELTGPGSDYQCLKVIEAMRGDRQVLSIHTDLEQIDLG